MKNSVRLPPVICLSAAAAVAEKNKNYYGKKQTKKRRIKFFLREKIKNKLL